MRSIRLGALFSAAVLIGIFAVAGSPDAARAYSYQPCRWSSTGPSYNNMGGSGFASEITASVVEWITRTDITAMSNTTSSTWKMRVQNMGANGYDGMTSWNCGSPYTTSADSRINSYYTYAYTVAQRKAVWVHEIGHGFGMGHSTVSVAIMYHCPVCIYNNYNINTPITDDINGIDARY